AVRGRVPALLARAPASATRQGSRAGGRSGRADGLAALEERELGGARGLGHVRHQVRGAPGPPADPHVRGVRGAPPPEGLSAPRAPAARAGAGSDPAAVAAADGDLMSTAPGSLTPKRFVEPADPTREIMEIQMGPSHPASHGTVKFNLRLDGETIVDIDV